MTSVSTCSTIGFPVGGGGGGGTRHNTCQPSRFGRDRPDIEDGNRHPKFTATCVCLFVPRYGIAPISGLHRLAGTLHVITRQTSVEGLCSCMGSRPCTHANVTSPDFTPDYFLSHCDLSTNDVVMNSLSSSSYPKVTIAKSPTYLFSGYCNLRVNLQRTTQHHPECYHQVLLLEVKTRQSKR